MSPRGKARNERLRDVSTARITEGALKVFAKYGYHGATMRRIAQATGLSYGLFYHYFPSKARIFRFLLESTLKSPLAAMDSVFAMPGTAWEKIESFSMLFIRGVMTEETLLSFLFVQHAMTQGKGIPGVPGLMDTYITAYYERMVPVIRRAQEDGDAAEGDPSALASAYFSIAQGLALLAPQGRGMEKVTPDMLSNVLRRRDPRP